MPDGVGDGFLSAADQRVGLIGADPHAGRDLHMDRRERNSLRKRLQRVLQIGSLALLQGSDDIAHLAEEFAGEAFGLDHMLLRPTGILDVAGDLEL